jgi:hypothetical protein
MKDNIMLVPDDLKHKNPSEETRMKKSRKKNKRN